MALRVENVREIWLKQHTCGHKRPADGVAVIDINAHLIEYTIPWPAMRTHLYVVLATNLGLPTQSQEVLHLIRPEFPSIGFWSWLTPQSFSHLKRDERLRRRQR